MPSRDAASWSPRTTLGRFFPAFNSISIQPLTRFHFRLGQRSYIFFGYSLICLKKFYPLYLNSRKARFKSINFVPSIPEFRKSVPTTHRWASRFLLKWWFVFRLIVKWPNGIEKPNDTAYLWLRRISTYSCEKGPQFSGNSVPREQAEKSRPL